MMLQLYLSSTAARESPNHIPVHSNISATHEILALFVLRKLILQTRMRSHPEGLDLWFLVEPFGYFHTLCERTAKALARLTWAFAGRLCDKYHSLTSWLILSSHLFACRPFFSAPLIISADFFSLCQRFYRCCCIIWRSSRWSWLRHNRALQLHHERCYELPRMSLGNIQKFPVASYLMGLDPPFLFKL